MDPRQTNARAADPGAEHDHQNGPIVAPLSRELAESIAWEQYHSSSPAVVELLLLANDPDVTDRERLRAMLALEWFDPEAVLPLRPCDTAESRAVRLLREAFESGEVATRIQAGDELAELLKRASGERADVEALAVRR